MFLLLSTIYGFFLLSVHIMNSYFEQSGFYGQPTGGPEQAYRFPLGLAGMGVSPYAAAAQHQPRPPQDYDSTGGGGGGGGAASSPKSSSLYSPLSDTPAASYKPTDCNSKDQNGYGSLSKELNAAAAAGWNGSSTPVRPSVCTPDMTRYTPTAVDVAARDRWMNTCSLSSASQAAAAAAQPQLQQAASANHTFYPWMAIAGMLLLLSGSS